MIDVPRLYKYRVWRVGLDGSAVRQPGNSLSYEQLMDLTDWTPCDVSKIRSMVVFHYLQIGDTLIQKTNDL